MCMSIPSLKAPLVLSGCLRGVRNLSSPLEVCCVEPGQRSDVRFPASFSDRVDRGTDGLDYNGLHLHVLDEGKKNYLSEISPS
jgi:hypothetical protein